MDESRRMGDDPSFCFMRVRNHGISTHLKSMESGCLVSLLRGLNDGRKVPLLIPRLFFMLCVGML